MTPLLITAMLLAPADLVAPPPPDAPKADPMKEAFKLVEVGKNTVANLEKGINIYEANMSKASAKAKCLAQTDISRAWLRVGDLKSKKKEKLKAFEAGKAAGTKAIKVCAGQSAKLRSEALAYEVFNLAKVGETNGVMNSLFMVGDLKKGLKKALEIDPNNSYARSTLGTIFHALPGIAGGSDKKAIEHYEESIRRSPGFGSGMCELAQLYLDKGKKDKAREWSDKLLAIQNPEFKNDHWKFDKPCARRHLKKITK
jgi:tetratricopeptide (TPR) repeat protein